ncbi:MAG: NAD(FAD)-utilizing dehydrogenase [Eubacterium sp.]|nr:NAD(FAD)-utilizing dehydrogenase [Eubacterium sp.]
MYRIHEIKLDIGESWDALPKKIAGKLKIKPEEILEYTVVKESIDARDKGNLKMIYSVDFKCNRNLKVAKAPDLQYKFVESVYPTDKRIAIAGFGPCGMFAALVLAQMGYKPVVLERGKSVDERTADVERFWNGGKLDENSNVQFGEGGAGTFSDGKLTTGIKDPRIRKVLEEFHRFGAPEDILYKQKPHIGTDVLKVVVANLRNEVIRLGGEIRFSSQVTDIRCEEGKLTGLVVQNNEEEYFLPCDKAVFSIGHSARDTFKMLYDRGVEMSQKPFSIGVRIEHPQEIINKAQYGDPKLAKELGAAEYKLNHRTSSGRGVYTFCMCPGGEVVMASSSEGQVVTNGMSYRARDGEFANSGLLVDVRTEDFESDHPLSGVAFQEKYERKAYEISGGYKFPQCTWKEFKESDLAKCLPEFAVESIIEALPFMGRKLKGFDMPDA